MLSVAADLPDTLVGLAPDFLKVPEKFALHIPAGLGCGKPLAPRMMKRIHDFAKDVKLELPVGGIADADRARAFIARQPRHLPSGEAALAGNPVHDLELIGTAGYRAQQPTAPRPRLLLITGI